MAGGDKALVDVKALDEALDAMPANLRTDACYFAGRFLERRGDDKGAVRYLTRCVNATEAKTAVICEHCSDWAKKP